jgi:pectate lyase
MKKLNSILLLILISVSFLNAQLPAFPGAEGFGRFSLGARAASNPTIYRVTNLNDSGSGSFRDAISQPNRIVVFDVSGVIRISSRLVFSSNLTVAGQTAPGDGVTVYGNGVSFSGARNVIVRHMRFRMGVKGDSGKDAAGIANGSDMIFDHCSFTWGLDETFSISWDGKGTEPGNITIQNSIIGQGIMAHSAGGLMQTNGGVTLYKNLYIDNKTRNPKVKGLNQYVNNVIYNWGSGGGYILGDTEASSWGVIEGNYFIKGPSTGGTSAFNRANAWFQVYGNDNILDYNRDGQLNGTPATPSDYGPVTFVSSYSGFTGIPKQHPAIDNKLTAQQAYQWVVDSVGACLPARDEVDKYLIDELASLGVKGALINGEADLGLPGGVGHVFAANKLPDADGDGIPDFWEEANGLNKNNAADAVQLHESGYLNIERYINSIRAGNPFVKYPTALSVKLVDENFVTLRWTNHADVATGIVLEMSNDNVQFSEHAVLSPEIAEYQVTGLTKSTTYFFRLKARNGTLESLYTPSLKATTIGADAPPVACTDPDPANGALLSVFNQVTLKWSNPSAATGVLYYNLYLGTSPESMTQRTAGTTSTSFTAAISPGVTYYWRVDAMNVLGIQEGDVWSFTTGYRPPKEKVAYFSFDETSGNTAENEIEGYASAVGFTPQWAAGKVNNGLQFSGSPTSAAMVQPHYDAILLGNESFSVELWFKSAGGAVDWYLIHKGSHVRNTTTGSTGKWFGLQYNKTGSNDRFTWAIDDDAVKTDINVTPGSALFNNQWQHVVAIRDVEQKQIRIYVNGVMRASKADGTADIGQTENLVIGNTNNPNATPTNAFAGVIDEVAIYKGVLSDAEVVENYQKGLQTGFANSATLLNANVYPSPFTHQLFVRSSELQGKTADVKLISASGQVWYHVQADIVNQEIRLTGLDHLPKGSYLCYIGNSESKLVVKVLK